jgi:hypothetical protein
MKGKGMESFAGGDWRTVWQRPKLPLTSIEQCTVVSQRENIGANMEASITETLTFVRRFVQPSRLQLGFLIVVLADTAAHINDAARRWADELLRVQSPTQYHLVRAEARPHAAILRDCLESGQIALPVVDHLAIILDFSRPR